MNHLDDGTARGVEKGLSHFCEVLDLDELKDFQRNRRAQRNRQRQRTPAVAQGTEQAAAVADMAVAGDLGAAEGSGGVSGGGSDGGSGLWKFLPESAYDAFTSDVHQHGSILGRQAVMVGSPPRSMSIASVAHP